MPRYSHAYDLAFEVETDIRDPFEVPPGILKAALLARIESIFSTDEWREAFGCFDTCDLEK